ncbi:MAG: sigma-70 family RNA polymerase sigma factor [Clostridium tyrobutyricum]|uniref:sigma-70 family RNA polymerase sigma factor n=1 Tax=Clostridium tyrobutyricum TaxID=1519 RepID=UPI0002FD2F01|nr:sigma-70 family RNA polymerase sigma factor [Clostridium tyrobutyricum]MBV4425710.1 sigma-70 family RNA polymerase sigma factor [Clostridium tyrobutyricum]MBV4431436.1 sigma-70 family RNA polymerase sigma factor [Clostridium tyrobutyricum]MBV4436414.1 sigma-70 family RNA polymerase sigma factor [Clostridium tyrobutyricum]MBV4440894.1 sigma-70 family RNA polymerase sigma factor [Clostridium tyrobutyricum]MCH4199477.1 sigma-70 family RNA polymerase sigma factor [Clostridium tyrobutyricum]
MSIDQNNFVNKLKCRNPKALEYIFNTYADTVYRVIYRVFASSEYVTYVDECINDSFMCVWNNIDAFDIQKGNFKNWLMTIAKYKAINYKKKIIKSKNIDCIEDYVFSSKEQVEDILVSKENKNEVIKAIGQLKKLDREIFIRRYLIQEDIIDIAESMGVNRNVIDNRLTRGRKILKEKLAFLKKGGCINE